MNKPTLFQELRSTYDSQAQPPLKPAHVRVSTHNSFGYKIWGILDPKWQLIPEERRTDFIKIREDHPDEVTTEANNMPCRKALTGTDRRAVLQDREYLVPLTIIFDDVRINKGLAVANKIWETGDADHNLFEVSEYYDQATQKGDPKAQELQTIGRAMRYARRDQHDQFVKSWKELSQGEPETHIKNFRRYVETWVRLLQTLCNSIARMPFQLTVGCIAVTARVFAVHSSGLRAALPGC